MSQACDLHNNMILAVCLFKGCNQLVLCCKCMREHPENHDSSIKELELMKNDNWLEEFEKKRDSLILQETNLRSEKDKIVNTSKSVLNMKVQEIINRFQDQKDKFLEEFNDLPIKNLILSLLDNDINKLGSFDFRDSQNLFEKIKKAKTFIEEIVPNTENLIKSTRDTLESWKIDEEKIKAYQSKCVESICSFNLKDFLCLSNENFHRLPDTFVALKEANERLEFDLKKSYDIIEKLKAKESEQAQALDLANLNLKNSTQNNNELQKKVTELELEVKKYSIPLKNLIKALSNKSETQCGPIIKIGDNYSWYFCKGRRNNCTSNGKVWGSNPYTEDSDLCKAAYHCGVISGYGGFALIKWSNQELTYYEGSYRNAIQTSSFTKPFKPMWFILNKDEENLI